MADGSATNNKNNLQSSRWFAFYSGGHRMTYFMGQSRAGHPKEQYDIYSLNFKAILSEEERL